MFVIERAKKHLLDNNMAYREHLVFAVSSGLTCLLAGLVLIVHGFFPFFFERLGSDLVNKLKSSFDSHKQN